ncbi:poly-gamma-glutamate hydrolase family protein [Thermodesulfobacteriota bacterium]
MGKYQDFDSLKRFETAGKDFEILSRDGTTGIAVVAPHGGGIEPGTTEIAQAVAGDEHAFYCFKGIKLSGNADLHLPSVSFDEPHGVRIAQNADTVLSVHGCREKDTDVFIGGLNHEFIDRLKESLTRSGFRIGETADGLQGLSPDNICNRCRRKQGAQLEISASLRKSMFDDAKHFSERPDSDLFYRFVSAVRNAIAIYNG